MESQKIKDNRRTKFLSKMENKKKTIKKQSQNSSPFNNIYSMPQISPFSQGQNIHTINTNFNYINNQNLNNLNNNIDLLHNLTNQNINNIRANNYLNNNLNNNFGNNYINNNFQSYYRKRPKINYNQLLEKIEQFDYMINFQSILKKIIIIILTILHCLKYTPLQKIFIFKYTLIVLEISSLLFNKYYYDQKKYLTENVLNQKNNNISVQPPDQKDSISQLLMDNLGIFNKAIVFYNFIKDIIADIFILFIINVTFFLINNEE